MLDITKIDMEKIHNIIYSIDILSNIQKDLYYQTILIRKEYILDKYYIRYTKNISF